MHRAARQCIRNDCIGLGYDGGMHKQKWTSSEYIEFELSLASSRGRDIKSGRIMPQKSDACLSRGCVSVTYDETEIKSRSNKREWKSDT